MVGGRLLGCLKHKQLEKGDGETGGWMMDGWMDGFVDFWLTYLGYGRKFCKVSGRSDLSVW